MAGISDRQLELLQGAAAVLVGSFQFTKEEAIGVIIAALKRECGEKQITLEALDIRPRAERASFVRGVVKHVQADLTLRKTWPKEHIAGAIANFMQVLHDSWMRENS